VVSSVARLAYTILFQMADIEGNYAVNFDSTSFYSKSMNKVTNQGSSGRSKHHHVVRNRSLCLNPLCKPPLLRIVTRSSSQYHIHRPSFQFFPLYQNHQELSRCILERKICAQSFCFEREHLMVRNSYRERYRGRSPRSCSEGRRKKCRVREYKG
jgi:hypothetical protein